MIKPNSFYLSYLIALCLTPYANSLHPQMLGDFLQLLKNGTYNVVRNGNTVETGNIEVESQTVNELSIKFIPIELDFGSDSFISLSHSTLNVMTITRDSIRLHNNAVDGGYFGLSLKRKK